MRRVFFGLVYALIGYAAGGLLGYLMVSLFSGNMHDREVEALMTGAFVAGPMVALVSAVAGAMRGGPRVGPD